MTDISFAAAVGGGLLSFLSPCVLPLAPPYLCYIAGASIEELTQGGESSARRRTLIASLLFVAGFSTVFIALGATASLVGALLRQWSHALSLLAGLGIVAMGLHFLGVFRISALFAEKRLAVAAPPGLWSAYFMGLAFAFGWTPCIGPILAAILAVAGAKATVAMGAALLAAYSLGLGLPFIAAAFAMGPFLKFAQRFRARFAIVEKTVGGLLVVTGIAFLTGGIQSAAVWLIDIFPALTRLG